MIVRRLSALIASLFAMTVALMGTALADTATYPPVQGGGTGVEGVRVGSDAGAGVLGTSFGGLAHTGFQFGLLLGGVALLTLGLLLVVVTRRRQTV